MTSETIGIFPPQQPVAPQHLEYLGKEAALFAESTGLGLTEAVIRTLSSEKLGSEQVTRVVEFANIEAFQRKFASLDSSLRAVDIEGGPADPQRVLQSMNNQASPARLELQTLDYDMAPEPKIAHVVDFGLGEVQPEPEYTRNGVLGDIVKVRAKLASAQEETVASAESSRFQMTTSLEQLQESVKMAARHEGLMQEDLINAWGRTDPSVVGAALKYMPKLSSRGTTKVAQQVNPQHPVVQHYAEFAKHAQRYGTYTAARTNIERRITQVDTWLQENRT